MKKSDIKPKCQVRAYALVPILSASDPNTVVVDPSNPDEGGASGAHSKEYEEMGIWED